MFLSFGYIIILTVSLLLALTSNGTAISAGLYLIALITVVLFIKRLVIKREIYFTHLWQNIYKSASTNINYSSDFGLKRNLGHILNDLCELTSITGAWVIMKNIDGNYRIEVQRGRINLSYNLGIKDLSEYIEGNIKEFEKPLIKDHLPPMINSKKKGLCLHIPISRGKLIRGAVTVTTTSKRYFKKHRVNNFVNIAKLIEQLYENADRNNQLQKVVRKVNEKVDVATDELTKTNIRLIDRVKEFKSLYDISLRVINAETTAEAVKVIFKKIKVILGAEKSMFFENRDGEFILRYVSDENSEKTLKEKTLPFSILPKKKGIILNDTTKDKDLNHITKQYNLNYIMIAPVRAGETIKGVIITGVKEGGEFSGRDVELLEIYSNQLGEYIDRKGLMDKVIRDNKRLKELNEVKDKFISLISHELRTPLTNIKGFGELLLGGDVGQVNSDQENFLKTILRSTFKLETTINNIIEVTDFKKHEVKLEKESVKWEEFIKSSVEEFREILEKKEINCTIKVDSSIGMLYVDRKRVKKVFDNLISNAVKFMGKKGDITITSEKQGEKVKTVIKDTGIGIKESMKDKVFEGFTRADETLTRNSDGLGLGLTLVKYIIGNHGGNIDIKSTQGKGTEVIFSLPAGRSA